jgi:asparagine synthase (glutamine-hydrolysing)
VLGEIALSKGVEPRSPFSDRRMIEFAIRMPIENKLFAHWYKPLMRKSMAGVLPEEVRWRRKVRTHPGWKFHEQFMTKAIAGATDIWNFPRIASTLGNWIDPPSLSRARMQYEMKTDYETGYNLFALAVLAKWMITRGLSASCE